MILEPVQAEAGVMIPPHGYLRRVREACDRHGALLIFDEIQSGMGRTGAWWACDREQVAPDIMLAGKSLSGGCVPVGAMIATEAVYAPFNRHPLLHSSTFGGNPLAMAAVRATLRVMDDEDLVSRAAVLGTRLRRDLQRAIDERGGEARVTLRSAGLLFGIGFGDASDAAALALAMLERRVIVCHSMNDHRIVRLTPPAVLADDDCDDLADAFGAALTQTLGPIGSGCHEAKP